MAESGESMGPLRLLMSVSAKAETLPTPPRFARESLHLLPVLLGACRPGVTSKGLVVPQQVWQHGELLPVPEHQELIDV